MKKILLIRHAKSCREDTSLNDLDRPLTTKGKKDAIELGKWLKKKEIKPQLIISSPAKRARKTAKRIAEILKYENKKIKKKKIIYFGTVSGIIKYINTLDAKFDMVFFVGHNPTLLDLANCLSDSKIDKFETSGAILINFQVKSWGDIDYAKGDVVFTK